MSHLADATPRDTRFVDFILAALVVGLAALVWRLTVGDAFPQFLVYLGAVPLAFCLAFALILSALADPMALLFPAAGVAMIVFVMQVRRVLPARPIRIVVLTLVLGAFSAWIAYNAGQLGV